MYKYINLTQLDILGLTKEFRLAFYICLGAIIITAILLPFMQMIIKRQYYYVSNFLISSLIILGLIHFYEPYYDEGNLYVTTLRALALFGLLYSAWLIFKAAKKAQ